ncbi:Surface polysaccharide O-acyltransferase, integral membrane enzyme [Lachnospiraceae bacterium XBB1006]|nr:Surface polysaccharide O-acyltransferase, integral membrane enzyme [Lachnospiraceae bacterium XBB1006]
MKKEKDTNVELLRVVSCVMVVFIHVANYYCRAMEELSVGSYVFATIVNGICRVSVPLFFMISGSLLVGRDVDIRRNFNRVRNILQPLIIWSMVYAVWNYAYRDRGYYDLKEMFAEPVKRHLWYLYVLVGIYLTLPFWQKLFQGMSEYMVQYFVLLYICLLTINFVLALLNMEVRYQIPLVGSSCHLGYFIMGYIIRQYRERLRLRRLWAMILAITSMGFVIGATLYYSLRVGQHNENFFEYRNVLIGIASMAIFYIAMKSKPYRLPDTVRCWVELVAKHSFTIYLAHVLFLDILKEEVEMIDFGAFVGIPLFASMIFMATFLFAGFVWWGKTKMIKR